MCIRDRLHPDRSGRPSAGRRQGRVLHAAPRRAAVAGPQVCLLYTSDAADERSSVDLGGRRIIKKKKKDKSSVDRYI